MISVGDVVGLKGTPLTGIVVSQSEGSQAGMYFGWSDVKWDNKEMQYSGGPLGPPGVYPVTDPESWPTSYLAPLVCLCCETAGDEVLLTRENTVYRDGSRQHVVPRYDDDAPLLHGPAEPKGDTDGV